MVGTCGSHVRWVRVCGRAGRSSLPWNVSEETLLVGTCGSDMMDMRLACPLDEGPLEAVLRTSGPLVPTFGSFQRGTTKILCAELGSLDRIGAMPVVFLEKKEPLVRQVKKKTL